MLGIAAGGFVLRMARRRHRARNTGSHAALAQQPADLDPLAFVTAWRIEIDRQLRVFDLLEEGAQPFGRALVETALSRDPFTAALAARADLGFRHINQQRVFLDFRHLRGLGRCHGRAALTRQRRRGKPRHQQTP